MGRQTRLEVTVFIWKSDVKQFSESFASEQFMNWKLLALGKGFFQKKNWRDVAVPESVQSCFELPIHFFFFLNSIFIQEYLV